MTDNVLITFKCPKCGAPCMGTKEQVDAIEAGTLTPDGKFLYCSGFIGGVHRMIEAEKKPGFDSGDTPQADEILDWMVLQNAS